LAANQQLSAATILSCIAQRLAELLDDDEDGDDDVAKDEDEDEGGL
jgi:hypothetical protein